MNQKAEELMARISDFVPANWIGNLRLCASWTESPIEELFLYAVVAIALPTNRVEIRRDDLRAKSFALPLPIASSESLTISLQPKIGGFRPDFQLAFAGKSLLIECDGHDFHERTREQAARDKSRDRLLTVLGHVVWRFTGGELHEAAPRHAESALRFIGMSDLSRRLFERDRRSTIILPTSFSPAFKEAEPSRIETAFVALVLRDSRLLLKDSYWASEGIEHSGLRSALGAIQSGRVGDDAMAEAGPATQAAIHSALAQLPTLELQDAVFFSVCQKLWLRRVDQQLTELAKQTAAAPSLEFVTELQAERLGLLDLRRHLSEARDFSGLR